MFSKLINLVKQDILANANDEEEITPKAAAAATANVEMNGRA